MKRTKKEARIAATAPDLKEKVTNLVTSTVYYILWFVASILDLDVDWDTDFEDDIFVVERRERREGISLR